MKSEIRSRPLEASASSRRSRHRPLAPYPPSRRTFPEFPEAEVLEAKADIPVKAVPSDPEASAPRKAVATGVWPPATLPLLPAAPWVPASAETNGLLPRPYSRTLPPPPGFDAAAAAQPPLRLVAQCASQRVQPEKRRASHAGSVARSRLFARERWWVLLHGHRSEAVELRASATPQPPQRSILVDFQPQQDSGCKLLERLAPLGLRPLVSYSRRSKTGAPHGNTILVRHNHRRRRNTS